MAGHEKKSEMMSGYNVNERDAQDTDHGQCRVSTPIRQVAQCVLAGRCSGNCSAANRLIARLEQHLPPDQQSHPCLRSNRQVSGFICLTSVKKGDCRHFTKEKCQPPFTLLLAKVAQDGEAALPQDEVEQSLVEITDADGLEEKFVARPRTVLRPRVLIQPVDMRLKQNAAARIARRILARSNGHRPQVRILDEPASVSKPFICDQCRRPAENIHLIQRTGRRGDLRLCDHCRLG